MLQGYIRTSSVVHEVPYDRATYCVPVLVQEDATEHVGAVLDRVKPEHLVSECYFCKCHWCL